MKRLAGGVAAAAVALAGFGTAAPAPTVTGVVLAERVALTDEAPDARFDPTALVETLRAGIGATAGFEIVVLSPDRLLSPNERVVAVVPVVSTARVSRERRGGAIVELTAFVGGGLWVLDPWTDAVLHATSRLVSAPVQVAANVPEREDDAIREAVRRALGHFAEESLDQLRRDVSPFVVEGPTGAVPPRARTTRGVWLRGRAHGVRPGMIARSDDGDLARVERVSERFSTLRDVADPSAPLPAGRRYRAIAASEPGRRPEPILRLEWLGGEADGASPGRGIAGPTLVDFVQNYVARDGGLRIPPATAGGVERSPAFRDLSTSISRHAKLLSGSSGMTLHRETKLRIAEEEPDLVGELGVVDTYHGTRTHPDGRVEHLVRVTLLATVGTPLPEGGVALGRAFTTTEEQAAVEMEGVRELRPEDLWFTALRNACVRAGGALREAALARGGDAARLRAGRAGASGEVAWNGGPPGLHTPLVWLRPAGTVRDERGAALPEPLLEPVDPSRGFLTLTVLSEESVAPGDVLEFRAASATQPPLADLLVRAPGPVAARALAPEVLVRLAAERLAATKHVAPRIAGGGGVAPGGLSLELVVSAPSVSETAEATRLSGEWRLFLRNGGDANEGEPALKTGIAYSEERRHETGRPPLRPRDRGAELAQFRDAALDRLVATFVEKGLARAAGASARAARERKE